MDNIELLQFAGPEQLAQRAASDCAQLLSEASHASDIFSVALSGGRIAKTFCSLLAQQVRTRSLTLKNIHFFWSDERCVPPDDAESNFRLANDSLLRPLEIPISRIHRLEGEKPPDQAFVAAQADLLKMVTVHAGQPVLSLVFLGMGEDGHVASLFPGESEERVADPAVFRCVTAVKPPALRITLGYAAIAAAQRVWVLASGDGKAAALKESLRSNGSTPLARVLQMRAATRIYTDLPVPD